MIALYAFGSRLVQGRCVVGMVLVGRSDVLGREIGCSAEVDGAVDEICFVTVLGGNGEQVLFSIGRSMGFIDIAQVL